MLCGPSVQICIIRFVLITFAAVSDSHQINSLVKQMVGLPNKQMAVTLSKERDGWLGA